MANISGNTSGTEKDGTPTEISSKTRKGMSKMTINYFQLFTLSTTLAMDSYLGRKYPVAQFGRNST